MVALLWARRNFDGKRHGLRQTCDLPHKIHAKPAFRYMRNVRFVKRDLTLSIKRPL
jgi:hypothetical protein